MQPSELAKIAFAIWGAHLLAARRMERASLREMLIPLVPAAVIALALIVAQPDLGQTVSLGIILLALLWYAGLPLRVFLSSLFAAVVVGGGAGDVRGLPVRPGACPGSTPAPTRRAPATRPGRPGSRWPTAASSATGWARAPPSGTTCPTRTTTSSSRSSARSSASSAPRACCACSACSPTPGCGSRAGRPTRSCGCSPPPPRMWVLGQVFINVGYVVGLLPVTGLQLPLISAGGTSTATTLLIIGVIANAARHEPEAVAALRAGREDRVNRLLRLPLPEPYVADPHRGAARPAAVTPAKPASQAGGQGADRKPAKDNRRKPHAADRPVRRSGHHGGGQRATARLGSATRARRARTLEGQRHG